MKEYVICKSCGYIMEKGKLKDKCPACGVPAKMFSEHQDNVSQFRRMVLSLDIHPVLVHFPQAFAFSTLVLSILCLIFPGAFGGVLLATLKVLGVILPFVVAAGFLGGLLDGIIRFRKVTTNILLKKIVLGSTFFLFSMIGLFLVIFTPPNYLIFFLFSALISEFCSIKLALLGVSILNAKFPG